MKKVFTLIPRENWIVDRIGSEFCHFSSHDARLSSFNCDIVWLLAPWCWRQVPWDILKEKKVVCSVHHEVPDKFTGNKMAEFLDRDMIVDQYIVPCQQTHDFISKYTDKPISIIGYWWNSEIWFPSSPSEKFETRKKLDIPNNDFVIGSFQRDTEGGDLKTPKLEKGPDIFCDYVKMLSDLNGERNIHVLLGGWRRQYVINRLSKDNIRFTYCEFPPLSDLRAMYSVCDLYVSTSRYEGGPQCLFEATATRINLISSNVGMASDCVDECCIVDDFSAETSFRELSNRHIELNAKKIKNFELKCHIRNYDKFFERV
jgi:glycosyltransferase involved in cell wall biosynthesis